jgi:hypothetical protein
MSNAIEAILAAKGIDLGQPEWRVISDEPVGVERFGKDHYSTLLYIETRAVDHKGMLNHDNMRCDADRHPFLAQATKRSLAFPPSATKYPSFLRGGEHLADHDDYDCADDLVAAGMVTVTMPVEDDGEFRDANGHVVRNPESQPFNPKVFTGMDELLLGRSATWGLTEYGFKVASALRAHRAAGGTTATFTVPGPDA